MDHCSSSNTSLSNPIKILCLKCFCWRWFWTGKIWLEDREFFPFIHGFLSMRVAGISWEWVIITCLCWFMGCWQRGCLFMEGLTVNYFLHPTSCQLLNHLFIKWFFLSVQNRKTLLSIQSSYRKDGSDPMKLQFMNIVLRHWSRGFLTLLVITYDLNVLQLNLFMLSWTTLMQMLYISRPTIPSRCLSTPHWQGATTEIDLIFIFIHFPWYNCQ